MTTITELVVAATVDPTGVRQGLDQSLSFAKQFARDAQNAFKNTDTSGSGSEQSGVALAEAMLAGMTTTFNSRKASLREQLTRGVIDRAQFEQMGAEAGQGFNTALLASMGKLADAGLLSDDLRVKLVGELREDGIRAGEAFEEGLTESTAGAGGLLSGLQTRLQSSSVSIAFAIEGLFNGSESGARRAARSISLLAFAIDPLAGALATVAATGGLAFLDWMNKAEKQAAKTAEEISKMYKSIGESGSLESASKRASQLFSGDKFVDDKDPFAKLIQSGGLDALYKQRQNLQVQQKNTKAAGANILGDPEQLSDYAIKMHDISESLKDVNARIAEAEPAYQKVNELVNQFTTKEAGEAQAKLAQLQFEHPFAGLVEDVGKSTTALQQMQSLGLTPSLSLIKTLQNEYATAGRLLEGQTNSASKQANVLRALQVDIAKTLSGLINVNNTLPTGPSGIGIGPNIVPGKEGETAAGANAAIARATAAQFTGDQLKALADLRQFQDALNTAVAAEGGPLRANLDLLNAQKEVATALAQLTVTVRPSATGGPLASIQSTVDAANTLRKQADAAKATGADNAGALEQSANDARQHAITLIRGILEATDSSTASTKEGRDALQQVLDLYNALGDVTGKTANNFATMRTTIEGILDAASGFGKVGQDIRNVGEGVLHTVSAFRDLQKINKARSDSGDSGGFSLSQIGAFVGVAGGIVSAVSGLAGLINGQSATQLEQNKILTQNTDALSSLRASLDDDKTASANLRAQQAVGQFNQSSIAGASQFSINFFKDLNSQAINNLTASLSQFGLTLDQAKDLAKSFGIDLFDSSGHVILAALQQFGDALKVAQQTLEKFTKSYDDQATLATLLNRTQGKTTPADAFNTTLSLLNSLAPSLAKSLEGIDVTTDDGRKKIEAALTQLVLSLQAGTITLEQLGDLEGAKQLAAIIATLQDSLDSLSSAANTVTGALLNVPTGYKVALARFNATDPQYANGSSYAPLSPSGPSDTTPGGARLPTPRFAPSSASSNVASASAGNNGVIVQGDVLVDARELPADQMFAAVLKVAKRTASVQFGNSTRWSEVQSV